MVKFQNLFLFIVLSFIFILSTADAGAGVQLGLNNGDINRSFVQVNVQNKEIDVYAHAVTGSGSKSALFFQFSLFGVPSIRVSYRKDMNKNGTGVDYDATMRVGFLSVVEVNGTINANSSMSKCGLIGRRVQWSNIQISDVASNNINATVKKLSTTFSGQGNCAGFSLTLDVYASTHKAAASGAPSLAPNSLKYGITMQGFPYQYQNSTLAIVKAVYSSTAKTVSNGTVDCGSQGYFGWNGTIVVNDTASLSVDVDDSFDDPSNSLSQDSDDNTHKSTESSRIVVFRFKTIRPGKIFWDPEVAMNDASLDQQLGGPNSSAFSNRLNPSYMALFVGALVGIFMTFM